MIPQSNAKDTRVQPNAHREPRAAVKSHWRTQEESEERVRLMVELLEH